MWQLVHEEGWGLKNGCQRIVLCWRRLLRIPWTARSNQSILKEISPEYHWKDWCWSWNSNTLATWCKELTHVKRPWCWERLRAGREEDDREWDDWMASRLDVHGFGWTPGVGDGQGGLACCDSWGRKELDTTEWLDWTELNWTEAIHFPLTWGNALIY